jgi:hypothetical protein
MSEYPYRSSVLIPNPLLSGVHAFALGFLSCDCVVDDDFVAEWSLLICESA